MLPDFREEDVCGSCFAVRDYRVHEDFGGDAALARLRERLQRRGLRLVLDFVPNHMAPDHPWVSEHPDFFVAGTEEQLAAQPQNYCRVDTGQGPRVLAYGRDPYFDGWPDTLQLNYGNPALQEAMLGELRRIARQCDGVRCDMAMLVLPEVFERTWGISAPAFWPRATEAVRAESRASSSSPRSTGTSSGRSSSRASTTPTTSGSTTAWRRATHARCASTSSRASTSRTAWPASSRTTTSHGPPPPSRPKCTGRPPSSPSSTPGLRFFHQGQREGKRVRIPVHLGRGPVEAAEPGSRRSTTACWSA